MSVRVHVVAVVWDPKGSSTKATGPIFLNFHDMAYLNVVIMDAQTVFFTFKK